jgi:hypothetical protein
MSREVIRRASSGIEENERFAADDATVLNESLAGAIKLRLATQDLREVAVEWREDFARLAEALRVTRLPK